MDLDTVERRYALARDSLLIEFGTRWTQRKPYILGLHRALTIALMVVAGSTGSRFIGLLALFAVAMAVELFEARFIRRATCTEDRIAIGTGLGMLFTGIGCSFTGGYASPLLPMLLAAVLIPAAAFGRRPPTWLLSGELMLILLALFLLPRSVLGPKLPGPWTTVGIGMSIAYVTWLSVVNILTITEIYTRAAVDAARMREQVLEQHDARARDLEQIGAKVAHELKNPLAAIAGLVQLLREGAHDPKTAERLSVVACEVRRVETVIRDYLAFARPIEAMRPTDVELAPLVDDVIALLEARAHARGVSLERLGVLVRAEIDALRVREALINLVDNAIEASHAAQTVSIEILRDPGRTIVRVRDRGEGISPEVLPRVGTAYFTTRASGTGLGVVVARSMIEAHGGSLALASRPGEGTVAEIVLPDRDTDDGGACASAA